MSNTKIVILYSRSLFAAGVHSLLQNIDGLDVIQVNATEDEALDRVKELAPQAIIVDAYDSGFMADVAIPTVLRQNSTAQLIRLNLNSNNVSIYRQEERLALTGADLVALINNEIGP